MLMLPYVPWTGLVAKALAKPYNAIALKDYPDIARTVATHGRA